jgi:hypothetical protein
VGVPRIGRVWWGIGGERAGPGKVMPSSCGNGIASSRSPGVLIGDLVSDSAEPALSLMNGHAV